MLLVPFKKGTLESARARVPCLPFVNLYRRLSPSHGLIVPPVPPFPRNCSKVTMVRRIATSCRQFIFHCPPNWVFAAATNRDTSGLFSLTVQIFTRRVSSIVSRPQRHDPVRKPYLSPV